ncbi:MBL fold metallo-hydrolase [Rapidithrix thailandica]|uniref:MBL fold metallo-hydrolase n=1 Tax=Rapidithrix thailandica TaxID=413964 RepID=A0AAW9SHL0_9BACT
MDIRVKFLGAAKTVTGSKYLLEIDQYKLLIDCGLFQGVKDLRLKNWEPFPVEPSLIDAVVLTHAHLDHSGYLPRLYKEGYQGPIYCTAATEDLLDVLLRDSAKLQEEEAAYAKKKGYSVHKDPKPLYDSKDVELVFPAIQSYEFRQPVKINEAITVTFYNAGHILGAAIVEVLVKGQHQTKKIIFSGDLGRYDDAILYDPEPVSEADILFIESTYGNRKNPLQEPVERLAEIINRTCERKGCLLIPAFAVGRTQAMLYYLKEVLDRQLIPEMNIFMDSPMAITATGLYRKHHIYHRLTDRDFREDESFMTLRKHLHIVRSAADSIALNEIRSNAIILSASGMMNGGRILHHLFHRLPRESDTLLLVGYQAEGTRGKRIMDGEKTVRVFGQPIPVACKVEFFEGLSAHADQDELVRWLEGFQSSPKRTFCVHGEEQCSEEFAALIRQKFSWNVDVPSFMERVDLFQGI